MLRTLLNSASAGTLLLLEDLDAAFTKSRDPNGRERSLTFSGTPSVRPIPGGQIVPRSQSEWCVIEHCKTCAGVVRWSLLGSS